MTLYEPNAHVGISSKITMQCRNSPLIPATRSARNYSISSGILWNFTTTPCSPPSQGGDEGVVFYLILSNYVGTIFSQLIVSRRDIEVIKIYKKSLKGHCSQTFLGLQNILPMFTNKA